MYVANKLIYEQLLEIMRNYGDFGLCLSGETLFWDGKTHVTLTHEW
jgi:hypothetical protein